MPLFRPLAALLLAAATSSASGAGNIDAEFGDGGRRNVVFDIGGDRLDDALAMDVAANGTVVLAGSARIDATHDCLAIARLLPDGTLDASFSGDGRYTEPVLCSGASIRIAAVKIDSSNRIVFAGTYQGDGNDPEFIVGRVNADGSGLDDSFGSFPATVRRRVDTYSSFQQLGDVRPMRRAAPCRADDRSGGSRRGRCAWVAHICNWEGAA